MQLTKHHGLGNDFLVALDLADEQPVTAEQAVALCDRTRGVGADGVIHLSGGGDTDLRMVLRNADGSRAEMSGNGISCAAQAALLAGVVVGPSISIDSDVGVKHLDLCEQASPTRHTFRAELGIVGLGEQAPDWVGDGVVAARWVDVGNPHLVLHVDHHDAVDLSEAGHRLNRSVPGGANLETVAFDGATGELSMRVFERGVGLTDACGTGACAVAAAAHDWGLADTRVTVRQPGGTATIEVGPPVRYTVEVVAVARVVWPWA